MFATIGALLVSTATAESYWNTPTARDASGTDLNGYVSFFFFFSF